MGYSTQVHAKTLTPDDPFDLSLQELLQIEVVSVSRHAQSQFSTAAASYVVTADDIKRTGATSLGEALQGVPGVQAARINGDRWAISVRGFAGIFSNKLLVLVDGRTVYNPLFSGVFWDNLELPMDEIERIEVIRGPGGSAWGANAVNGVINVITRHSRESSGIAFNSSLGDEQEVANIRVGGKLGKSGHYRLYSKLSNRPFYMPTRSGLSDLNDESVQYGLRADSQLSKTDELMVAIDTLSKEKQSFRGSIDPTTGNLVSQQNDGETESSSIQLRWTRTDSSESEKNLQFYYYEFEEDTVAGLQTEYSVYDLSFQQTLVFDTGAFVWGIDYTKRKYGSQGSQTRFLQPESGDEDDKSGFFNHEVKLNDGRASVNYGVRFADNERGGSAVHPKATVGFQLRENAFAWISYACAFRSPSISENQIFSGGFPIPEDFAQSLPFPQPISGALVGSGDLEAESSLSYDAGLRWTLSSAATIDVAVFKNKYSNLILASFSDILCQNGDSIQANPACLLSSPSLLVTTQTGNHGSAESWGLELAIAYEPSPNMLFRANYSYLDLSAGETPDETSAFIADLIVGTSPAKQIAVNWRYNFTEVWSVETNIRYVGEIEGVGVDDYTVFDLRVAWEPADSYSIALLGRDLGDRRHLELVDGFDGSPPTEIRRTVALQFSLNL